MLQYQFSIGSWAMIFLLITIRIISNNFERGVVKSLFNVLSFAFDLLSSAVVDGQSLEKK